MLSIIPIFRGSHEGHFCTLFSIVNAAGFPVTNTPNTCKYKIEYHYSMFSDVQLNRISNVYAATMVYTVEMMPVESNVICAFRTDCLNDCGARYVCVRVLDVISGREYSYRIKI